MTREVLKTDENGKPTLVVYHEAPQEREARRLARVEQVERGKAVAASVRRKKWAKKRKS